MPVDSIGNQLAGSLPTPYGWTTSNAGVVSLVGGASTNIVQIALGSPGTSTVTVTMGTTTTSVVITVS